MLRAGCPWKDTIITSSVWEFLPHNKEESITGVTRSIANFLHEILLRKSRKNIWKDFVPFLVISQVSMGVKS